VRLPAYLGNGKDCEKETQGRVALKQRKCVTHLVLDSKHRRSPLNRKIIGLIFLLSTEVGFR
jgi:hypothetical protein